MTRAESNGSVATHLRRELHELGDEVERCAKRVGTGDDDEAVHELRVAIRRLRTLLETGRGIFGKWRTDKVRRAYREIMRSTGELRDEEVLESILREASDHPAFVAWVEHRRRRTRDLHRTVVKLIERGAVEQARSLLDALLAFPVRPGRDRPLGKFARRAVHRSRRAVLDQGKVDPNDPKAAHELRIAHKRLRYATEVFADVLPEKWRKILDLAKRHQKRLGDLHDVDVAIAIVNDDPALGSRARKAALRGLDRLRSDRLRGVLRLTPLDRLQDTRHARQRPIGPLGGRRLL